jgi:hypothetical protein
LYLDTSFIHHYVHVLIRQHANFECGTDGPHYGIAGVNQEGPRAVVRNLEVRLALSQIDLSSVPPQVGFENGVGVQSHGRAVRQGDSALLTHGGCQGLQFTALLQPYRADRDCGEHGGGGKPPALRMVQQGQLRGIGERGDLLFALGLRKPIQGAPHRGKRGYRAPMARILAQPGLERLPVGGGDRGGVHAPDPHGRFLIDVGPRP